MIACFIFIKMKNLKKKKLLKVCKINKLIKLINDQLLGLKSERYKLMTQRYFARSRLHVFI